MNVEIWIRAKQFLFLEYLFWMYGIVSSVWVRCTADTHRLDNSKKGIISFFKNTMMLLLLTFHPHLHMYEYIKGTFDLVFNKKIFNVRCFTRLSWSMPRAYTVDRLQSIVQLVGITLSGVFKQSKSPEHYQSRSRIRGRTISFRFLGIILWVLRLEVCLCWHHKPVSNYFYWGGGGGSHY
jgi:hypothetical protein